jgi:hypothetical protein
MRLNSFAYTCENILAVADSSTIQKASLLGLEYEWIVRRETIGRVVDDFESYVANLSPSTDVLRIPNSYHGKVTSYIVAVRIFVPLTRKEFSDVKQVRLVDADTPFIQSPAGEVISV